MRRGPARRTAGSRGRPRCRSPGCPFAFRAMSACPGAAGGPGRSRRIGLLPMCGIVGYVGLAAGAGRRRRGSPAAGVPGLRLRRGRAGHRRRGSPRRSAPGSSPTSTRRWRTTRCPRLRPASATPAGPPTAPRTTATPTRTWGRTAASRSCTTGSSRTSPPCAPSWRPRATTCAPRPTPRWPRTCSRGRAHRARRHPGRGDAARRRRLEGAFTLVAVDARTTGPRGRRPPQLAARRRPGRGRELPGLRRRRLHRAHPGRARARPGPGGHDHPRRRRGHRLRRRARGATPYHVDWDLSAAEKGGYD